ncbi:MAG: hypothetical protein ACRDAM_00225 [Casimicrobium sp.]
MKADGEPKKLRAVADTSEVAKARYQLYKSAYSRVNEAIAEGYFLEAITIIESLIADRLESRLGFTSKKPEGFLTLGKLKARLAKETDATLKGIVDDELMEWTKRRNDALHGMAKLEHGVIEDWASRYLRQKKVAADGKALLGKIDKRVKALRRAQ